jgi:hypothetical protein
VALSSAAADNILMEMIMKVYQCTECRTTDKPCLAVNIQANGDEFKPTHCIGHCDNQKWTISDQYQITKTPEPVFYLDIKYPVQMHNITAAYMLKDWNGKKVTINGVSDDGQEQRCDQSTVWFPSRWLKQKPAEPTREELQERIDNMIEHSDKSSNFSRNAHNDLCEIAFPNSKR